MQETWVGKIPWRRERLSTPVFWPGEVHGLYSGVGEDSWESLDSKEIHPVNPKGDQSWIFIGKTDAKVETPILWLPAPRNWLTGKDPNARKVKAGAEGDDRGWDGWMASLTWWTWVWASSGSWWWTEKPDVLQSMGLQRVGHDWTGLNWTEIYKEVNCKSPGCI